MGLWHQMKVRLGLEDDWDDEYYDEDDEFADDGVDAGSEPEPRRDAPPYQSPYGSGAHPGAVKRLDREPDLDRARGSGSSSALRSVPTGGASVAPVAANMKMHIVEPKSFTEAQSIADKFKQGTPVIMNMAATPPDLAKRLLDFASGLTYGLDGGLQKVSDKVFMLTPHNIEVSDADRRRMRDTGLFSQ
ncbi:MAG: cell division protein SepF [Coriobacteriia bacterium]